MWRAWGGMQQRATIQLGMLQVKLIVRKSFKSISTCYAEWLTV